MMKNTECIMRGAVALVAVAAALCARGMNALRNTDLSMTDGMGGTVGWSVRATFDSSAKGVAKEPGVMEIAFNGPDTTYFFQKPVKLQSGGRYRYSADVRTTGLGGAKLFLLAWDNGWHRDVRSNLFPDDTNGEWKHVEWEGDIMKNSRPDAYSIGIAGEGGRNGIARAEVRNLEFVPLTPEAEAETKGISDTMVKPLVRRIVPIDPLLSKVCAEKGELTFFWPGEPVGGVASCTLVATVDGGRRQSVRLGASGRGKVAFGRLAIGEHRVEVSVAGADGKDLACNGYRIVACPPPPQGPAGRRLNNFVTELVKAPLADGEVRFFRPADGFVWISFEGCDGGARGWVDGEAEPAVFRREGEKYMEAMRKVKAGWHRLAVKGAGLGGTLRIHALKTVAGPTWPMVDGPCDFSGPRYKFSFPFARRFFLPSENVAKNIGTYVRQGDSKELPYYAGRGLGLMGEANISWSSPGWLDAGLQWKILSESEWKDGYDVAVDESGINSCRLQHVIFSESVWRMYEMRPSQAVSIFWGDATWYTYRDVKSLTTVLSAIANSGDGRGMLLPETYMPVLKTAEETDHWIDLFAQQVKDVAAIMPGAPDISTFHMSPWVDFGHWCDYPCPEADIKALYSRLLHAFATRPAFAANAGISTGATNVAEEELRRWISRIFRYYAIEGGTDNLADRFGFRWTPGFVKNCDFADGLDGWKAEPAAAGTLKAERIKKYGTSVQGRKKVPAGTGDGVAEFVASADGANRLSQRITGLEPGKLYSVMFCAANREGVDNALGKRPPVAFSARLEGGKELDGLRFIHFAQRKKGKLQHYMPIYRYVFRAEGSEATLVFEDRAPDGKALATGGRQVLNYIVFRPYYVEAPGEEDEIAALMAGR